MWRTLNNPSIYPIHPSIHPPHPPSGPFRYDYAGDGHWVYCRDGRELHKQLVQELEQLLGAAPKLDLE